jgi:hypothetical protein
MAQRPKPKNSLTSGEWDYVSEPMPGFTRTWNDLGGRSKDPESVRMGDGGGMFAHGYHGGIATDAPFTQVPTGRVGMSNTRAGTDKDPEVQAMDRLYAYGAKKFGGNPENVGDMPVEQILEAAYQDFPDDKQMMNDIAIAAYGMGVRPPWERGR